MGTLARTNGTILRGLRPLQVCDGPLLRLRAEQLLQRDVKFIANREFANLDRHEFIVSPSTGKPVGRRAGVIPVDLPAYFAALYEVPLLTPGEEVELFRAYNFLKFAADQLRSTLNPRRPAKTKVSEIERLLGEADQVRERIVRANLRLVVANARLFADAHNSFDDLVSDGNLSLIEAVEKFDFARGFRFSTYATHAIRRSYFRRISRKQRDRQRFVPTDPDILQSAPEREASEVDDGSSQKLYDRLMTRMSECLTDREQAIVRARFNLDGKGESQTLAVLAKRLGLCKERVRQLQHKAIEKLRDLAEEVQRELSLSVAVANPFAWG